MLAALALVACACGRMAGNDAVASGPIEATSRYAADDAGDAVVLPDDIVRGLSTDERVLACAPGTGDGASRFEPDWVSARRVELDREGSADWIVNGRHACLRDGSAADWWLYADDGRQRRLLLAAGAADALEVTGSRTRGFYDLRLVRGGQVQAAVYDGEAYALPATTAGKASPPADAGDNDGLAGETVPFVRFEETKSIDTVAGRLEMVPTATDVGRDDHMVRLAGKELLRTGDGHAFADFPVPQPKLRYGEGIAPFDEVVVVQQYSRGNACNGGPLWILGLKRDGSHEVSEPIDNCGGPDPVFAATRDQLTITLPGGTPNRGDGSIPPQTWVYRDGRLSRVDSPAPAP